MNAKLKRLRTLLGNTLFSVVVGLSIIGPVYADSLYIGDDGDNSVKRFDANTGAYQGDFVLPGSDGLLGPQGLIFTRGQLLVVN